MDLLHILFDDTYRSKVLFSNMCAHAYDLKVKVTDLQILIVNSLKAHLVHIWCDDRYRFRVLFNDTLALAHDLRVKVTGIF